jgi:hypothetical protein
MNSLKTIDNEQESTLNKNLVSACGLFCGACGIYLATKENDTEKILQYALVLNQTYEETLCEGCGAEKKSLHCSGMCQFIHCKQQNGIGICVDCPQFPCELMIEFKSKMPHRFGILESQQRLKEVGWEQWLNEMTDLFSCSQCNTMNSAYQLACRKCGKAPACRFVAQHWDSLEKYLSK